LTAFETKGPKAGSQKGRTIIEAIFWKYPRRVRHESPPQTLETTVFLRRKMRVKKYRNEFAPDRFEKD
jgi:hypothetical protein